MCLKRVPMLLLGVPLLETVIQLLPRTVLPLVAVGVSYEAFSLGVALGTAQPHIADQESPLVRQIFLQAIPDEVLPFLHFLPPETELKALGGTEDRVISSLPQASAVINVVSNEDLCSHQDCSLAQKNSSRLDRISRTLEEISRQMKKLSTGDRSRSISKHRKYAQLRSTFRDQRNKLCWYHYKLGDKASKCTPPCEYNISLN